MPANVAANVDTALKGYIASSTPGWQNDRKRPAMKPILIGSIIGILWALAFLVLFYVFDVGGVTFHYR